MQVRSDHQEFITLTTIIKAVSKMYFSALKMIDAKYYLKDSGGSLSDYEKYVKKVRNAFDRLNMVERQFINNDFFYKDYPLWWQKMYSRATYYRIRKRSMINFKEALENEF